MKTFSYICLTIKETMKKKELFTYIAGKPSETKGLYTIGDTKDLKRTEEQLEDMEILCHGTGFSKVDLNKLFYPKRIGIGGKTMLFLEPSELDTAFQLINGTIAEEGLKKVQETIENNSKEFEMLDIEDHRRKYVKKVVKKAPDVKRCDAFTFTFGKHIGKKITQMESDDELKYCKWLLKSAKEKLKTQKKKDKTMAHKAVEWWLGKGHASDIQKGKITKPTPAKYVFDFGKHEGKKITELTSDVDLGYCSWMYNKMVKDKKGRGTQQIKA